MLTTTSFNEALTKIFPLTKQKTFLLAISGGVDSMVLLDLCYREKLNFRVAHVNYHLRGHDSILDQKLVEEWCRTHKIPIYIYQVSDKDQRPEGSIENWAREIRYHFFYEIMHIHRLDCVMTAHHLNDRLETFIINLSKAAGLKGLKSIPTQNGEIIRPLLDFSKAEIETYAKVNQVNYREDYTNADTIFTRNKIRNKITPLLEEVNIDFLSNFKKSLQIIKDSKDFIDQQIDMIFNQISKNEGGIVIINQSALAKQSGFVQYEILQKFGLQNYTEIEKMLSAEKNKFFYSSNYQFLIGRDEIIITKTTSTQDEEQTIDLKTISENDEEIIIEIPQNIVTVGWIFNADNISLPLKFRFPKTTDIFAPKGMIGKKKLSKFLRDSKLSFVKSQNVKVLVDADDKILAVYPLRQSAKFVVDENTKKKLVLVSEMR